MTLKNKKIICVWIFVLGIINFLVYIALCGYFGGDASGGKIENGHYFLAYKGAYVEVSKSIFTYSSIHTFLMPFLHLSAILAFVTFLNLQNQKPKS